MSTTADKICIEVLSLPQDVRAEIAHRLLTSLEAVDFEDGTRETWLETIQRRRQEFANDRTGAVSAEKSMQEAERLIS